MQHAKEQVSTALLLLFMCTGCVCNTLHIEACRLVWYKYMELQCRLDHVACFRSFIVVNDLKHAMRPSLLPIIAVSVNRL